MNYLSFKYREGDFGFQEVVECLKFKTKTGDFQIKLVRAPNYHRPVSTNPIVFEGKDFRHCVYAMHSGGYGSKTYFSRNSDFPDSAEGFEQAKSLFDSLLLEFHKMKDQASPKRWRMFANKN